MSLWKNRDETLIIWPNFKPKKGKKKAKRKEKMEKYRKSRDSNLKTEKEYIEREENKKIEKEEYHCENTWDSNNLTWPNFKPKKWKENTKRKENKEEYRKNRDSNLKTEKEYIEHEENEKK